ncbi:MAG: tRNA (adenosine(37)-N6)-threonylcarbamoyltransferase complex dimerization subunit type 1 TsaB [Propionibacteriaceae bacterium]|nr:tRNA (adenosine(37)-N6)-threonylcarbamoyltransferase complex dimerization subunit type 1 TsaB [Propionibacteriaceae bacterium]
MSVVLGIDTSGVVCAGIAEDGEVLASDGIPDTRAHAEQLMPLVQRVVAEAGLIGLTDITEIAVGVGPGPFTGLRVGVVAAITLGEALGVGVRGVCSLDVLAHQAVTAGVLEIADQVRDDGDEAATSATVPTKPISVIPGYDPGSSHATTTEAATLRRADAGDFIVATDARRKEWYWATYTAEGSRASGPFVTAPGELPDLPRVGPVTGLAIEFDAGVLAAIAADLPEAGLEPLYLRRPDAEVPTARKSTLLPPRLAPRRIR